MASCSTCGLEVQGGSRYCANCGDPVVSIPSAQPEVVAELTAGTRLDERYEIVRALGRGGMGVVYLARDHERDGSLIALKLLPPELTSDPHGLALLKQEASVAMRLSHPNIVRLHNLEGRTRKYVTMEYVDGGSLADLLVARVRGQTVRPPDWSGAGLSPAEVVPLVEGIAAGLDHAHAERVIHRDMKPANVLIKRRGDTIVAKVADFGIAREIREMVSRVTQNVVAGTPSYMSPEHYRGEKLDGRADVYSVAATVYTLLAARPPFSGGELSWQILNKEPDPIPGVSPVVMNVIRRGMSKDMRGRPDTCGAFASAFAKAVASGGDELDSETIHPPATTDATPVTQDARPAPVEDTPTTKPAEPEPKLLQETQPAPVDAKWSGQVEDRRADRPPLHEPVPRPPLSDESPLDEPTVRPPQARGIGAAHAVVLVVLLGCAYPLLAPMLRPAGRDPVAPVSPAVLPRPFDDLERRKADDQAIADLMNDGRLEDASTALEALTSLTEHNVNTWVGLGRKLFRQSKAKLGQDAWDRVLVKNPGAAWLVKKTAEDMSRTDGDAGTKALAAAAALIARHDPGSHWSRDVIERLSGKPSSGNTLDEAHRAWSNGDYAAVVALIQALAEDQRRQPDLAVLLVGALVQLRQTGQATKLFAELPRAADLDSAVSCQVLFKSAVALSRPAVALEAAERWAAIADTAEAFRACATAAKLLGNPARAAQYTRQAEARPARPLPPAPVLGGGAAAH